MVIDLSNAVPFLIWFPEALLDWALFMAVSIAGLFFFGWAVSAVRLGPLVGLTKTWKTFARVAYDLASISPRRIWALSVLALKESLRRRIIVVFAIFLGLLLFAGWYLDPRSQDPAKLYLEFVLLSTSYLVLLMVLLLSTMSLPTDIKNRTLHTIVTKPTRSSEIVLGRIIGFTLIGTLLLAAMGALSFVFVERGLLHRHELTSADLRPEEGDSGANAVLVGKTGLTNNHRHEVRVLPSGAVKMELEQRHWHNVAVEKNGDKVTYKVDPRPEGLLTARVPIYGKLSFLSRTGQPAEKGINVGKEWTYRSYIEGGTMAAAVWSFSGITEEQFGRELPVEMTLSVYRSYKGTIEKGLAGSLILQNPKTGKKYEAKGFTARDYKVDQQFIPRTFTDANGKKIDIFKDVVVDGKLNVLVRCDEPMQYFGAAQADLYLHAKDESFALNFVKGFYGIWMQMVLLLTIGVFCSTFLSGAVAMVTSLGVMAGGFFHGFLTQVANRQTYGGGPFESVVRMLTQESITGDMTPGLLTTVVQRLDLIAASFLKIAGHVVPDFGQFSFVDFVAYGYNIPGDYVLRYTCILLAFVIPTVIAACFCLKVREVAR